MPENLSVNPQQHSPEDIQGWQGVADTMHEWHPDLRAHAERIIQERGIPVEMSQRAIVDAVEAVSYNHATEEAQRAAMQASGSAEYHRSNGPSSAEALTGIAHLNEKVLDAAFTAVNGITDSYVRSRVLEKLVPIGVARGRGRELIDAALERDDDGRYAHDNMRKAVAIELAKTDVNAALSIVSELKSDKSYSGDEGAYSINSVLEEIIDVAPEKSASEIYQNVKTYIDTSENKNKYAGSLVKLAPEVPEAGQEALAMLTSDEQGRRLDRAEQLATLSKSIHEAIVPAAELFSLENNSRRGSYSDSYKQREIQNTAEAIEKAISGMIEKGDVNTAAAALDAYDSHYHSLRKDLFKKCLETGQPQLALQQDHGSYNFMRTLPLLAQQGDTPTIREYLARVEKYGDGMECLIAAAAYVPAFMGEARTKLEGIGDSYKIRAIEAGLKSIKIDPTNIDGVKEFAAMIPDRDSGAIRFKLATIDPEIRQVFLTRMRQGAEPGSKVGALLELANGESAMIDEALTDFRTGMVPGLLNDSKYQQEEAARRIARVAPSLVGGLEADGRHAEALEVIQSVRHKDTLAKCLLNLEPTSAQEAANSLIALNDESDFIDTYTKKMAAALSNEQLKEVLVMIPEDHSGVRATLIKNLTSEFIASGDMSALFALVPDQADGSYAEAFKEIAPELIKNPNQAGLAEALSRIGEDKNCLQALLPLLESNPDLAPLAFSRLHTLEPRHAIWRHETNSFKANVLAQLMPLHPDAASYSMELAQSLDVDGRPGNSGYENNIESLNKIAEAFAKNGYGTEVFEIIKLFPSYSNYGQDLFKKIAPDLVENGWGSAAVDYARNIRNPAQRAYCLAAIIPPQDSEVWAQKREIAESLFGIGVLDLATHEATDRSANINLFVGDIAKYPLMIETFLSRASNPAEMLRIMQVVDRAAGELDDGTHLQVQALQLLTRFTSGATMKDQWSKDLQEQALGGEKADTYLFKHLANLQQLVRNLENLGQPKLQQLLQSGYTAEQLFTHPWLATTEIANLKDDVYPFDKGTSIQQEWLADHAFVRLEGFNRRAIGRLLETRLNNNLEYTLHDASQWLESFAIPDILEVYDSATNTTEHHNLKDTEAEVELLASIFQGNLSPEELRRLPGFASAGGEMTELKTQKFEGLFADPAHTVVYAALLQALAKKDEAEALTQESIDAIVQDWANSGIIENWAGQGKEITGTMRSINSSNNMLAHYARNTVDILNSDKYMIHKVPPQINHLRELSKARSSYIDSTTTWLRNYQNLSGQRLASAWANRNDAMRDGIEDKPAAIEEWLKSKGLRDYFAARVDSNGELAGGITPAALMERFPKFITELPSRYGPERSATALERLHQVFSPEADLPEAQIPLGDGYTFKVFAKNDPAGMTIGYDTDCCMTLQGASESCIYTGYSEPSAGFVGLYDGDNKLVAQSFVWHNEGTLVLDNIEAQRGRNLSNIQGQYKTALASYLKELHTSKPELGLNAVNIGTGYLEARLSEGLNRTETVKPKVHLGYSDATRSQLELLRLTPQELEATPEVLEVRQRETSGEPTQPPLAHPEFATVLNPVSQANEISRLEAQIYPNELQTGRAEILSDLRESGNFSFLIGSRTGNSGFVGYTIAYKDDSKDAVYVSDLAILPAEQRNGYGVAAIEHLLRRVNEAGEERLIFEARETTSYQALQSPNVQALLGQHGFEVTHSERLSDYFDNGESAYNVEIRKLAAVGA